MGEEIIYQSPRSRVLIVSGLPTLHELGLLSRSQALATRYSDSRGHDQPSFCRTLSKDFVRKSRILHGTSQYHATDHRRCLKDGFFPVPTSRGENVPPVPARTRL